MASKPKTSFERAAIRDRIQRALDSSPNFTTAQAREIGFHMLDWSEDLSELVDLFFDPEGHTDSEVLDALMGFLIHAPNHIAAAAKLMTGVPVADIFEVGAVKEEE